MLKIVEISLAPIAFWTAFLALGILTNVAA